MFPLICIKRFAVVIENGNRNNMSFPVTHPLFCDVASSPRILVRYEHRQACLNQSACVCQPVRLCSKYTLGFPMNSSVSTCLVLERKFCFLLKFYLSSFHVETQVNTLKTQNLYKQKAKSPRKTKESLKDTFEAVQTLSQGSPTIFW